MSIKGKIHWELTKLRDKDYMPEIIVIFIDWIRYWNIFYKEDNN